MKWILWLAITVLVGAVPTSAQTLVGAAPGRAGSLNSLYNAGSIVTALICFVPDVQHMAAGKQFAPDRIGATCGMTNPVSSLYPTVDPGCRAPYCNPGVYCKDTWRDTDARLLYNMAYEMTGQWYKEDYTGINGFNNSDHVASFMINPPNHPKCDIIVSLGDMADQPTFSSGNPNDPEVNNVNAIDDTGFTSDPNAEAWYNNQLSEQTKHEWVVTENFWRIIDASGVPYFPTKGNHDTKSAYRRMMNRLNFQAKPYFFAVETNDRQSWAILVPTNLGKPLCIISIEDGFVDALGTTDGTTAADRAFLTANIGCGGGFPTILEQHGLTGAALGAVQGPMAAYAQTTLRDASKSALFVLVGGHYGNTISFKVLVPAGTGGGVCGAGNCAYTYISDYANWQDVSRHFEGPALLNLPYGVTTQDSIGGYYTMMRILPPLQQVMMWDWGSYFQSTETPAVLQPGIKTTILSVNLDFTGRFP